MATNRSKQNTQKHKKPMTKKRRITITALLALALTAILTASTVGIYVLSFMVSYVNGEPQVNLEEYKENQDQTTFIYAYDANNEVTEIARLHGEQNRIWVTYRENPDESVIPQDLANAYIALEPLHRSPTEGRQGTVRFLQAVSKKEMQFGPPFRETAETLRFRFTALAQALYSVRASRSKNTLEPVAPVWP